MALLSNSLPEKIWSMCPYWWTIFPKTVCHFNALHSQLINDCTVPFSHFCFCTLSVLVGHFLSYLLPPKISKPCSMFWMLTNSQLAICFLCELHKLFWCSNLCCYILHWFSSNILLLQSVSAHFVITRNQYQCNIIQNCINCLVPKLSHNQYEVCSFKCWKPPTDFPNNMQINGCHLYSKMLHSTLGFWFWC